MNKLLKYDLLSTYSKNESTCLLTIEESKDGNNHIIEEFNNKKQEYSYKINEFFEF